MEAPDPYARLLSALEQVNFEGETPWLKWKTKDLDAIEHMFGNTTVGEDEDERDNTDRQSNVVAGRRLFALSQSKENPYRFSRIRAQNGSYLPVIPIALITRFMAADAEAMLTAIRINVLTTPAGWPAFRGIPLGDLWRMSPHHNWAGTLPERRISQGEATWYLNRRATHAYAMNEWQVRAANGQLACTFDGKLVTDPGAIRFVSVTGRRTLTQANMSYVAQGGGVYEEGYKGKLDQPKQSNIPRTYTPGQAPNVAVALPVGAPPNPGFIQPVASVPYTGQIRKVKDTNYRGVDERDRPHGQRGANPKRKDAFDLDLHERKPTRFYFSLNHYRTIVFNVSSRQVELNPWFLIVDD
jgi:hypothetical protein